ncbi:MAG TPA: hypothetical protein VGI89_12365 [Rhizomicrobium sp.]
MARNQFRPDLTCVYCDARGTIVWEENAAHAMQGPQRRLVSVDGEFHAETGRSKSGDPLIVCNVCAQPD